VQVIHCGFYSLFFSPLQGFLNFIVYGVAIDVFCQRGRKKKRNEECEDSILPKPEEQRLTYNGETRKWEECLT